MLWGNNPDLELKAENGERRGHNLNIQRNRSGNLSRFLKETKKWGHILPEKTPEEIEQREKSVYNISQMQKDVKRLNESLDISAIANKPNYNKKSEKKFLAKLPKKWKCCNWLDYPF